LAIPVIDIFAGPGGLGEGFCSLLNENRERVFKIALSIEKDADAHKTLTLRSFFRQFDLGQVPNDYFDLMRGEITLDDLKKRWPNEWEEAAKEAWCATLGDGKDAIKYSALDNRIAEALDGANDWLLIGGPPCQAYSVVGRSRRKEIILDASKDERVGLYKHYLRILAVHSPSVFIMENVKGLLSAETEESPVFSKILDDLKNPVRAYLSDFRANGQQLNCPGYKIYSLVAHPNKLDEELNPVYEHKKFVIRAENYGIPQTRHRVILLGVRNDIDVIPDILRKNSPVSIASVLAGLPRIRSGISKETDSPEVWINAIKQIVKGETLHGVDKKVLKKIKSFLPRLAAPQKDKGNEYIPCNPNNIGYRRDWFIDNRINGVCNHASRSHMRSDILRYFFAACYTKVHRRSPRIIDFPKALLPKHENVKEAIKDKKFADRFRVQISFQASKTITSHISKDGHYYIYYDPTQCRSFTVREAARIQTFPDNYFFCGTRTSQFHQVGNAVPPLLANKIAVIVKNIFLKMTEHEGTHENNQRLENA